MRKKIVVAVVSSDFRLAFTVQNAVNTYFSSYDHLAFNDDLSHVKVVITTRNEMKKINHPNIIPMSSDYSPSHIRSLIIKKLKQYTVDNSCVVGIDPGKTIGVALLYFGEVTNTNTFTLLDEMIYWIKHQIKVIPYDSLKIKIGDGHKASFDQLYMRVTNELGSYADIIAVNEFRTSIKGNNGRSIHEEAAIRIARRD